MGVCCEGVKGGRAQTSSVFIAPLSPPQWRNPCGTQEIHIENSSHKTHLIQLMQQMRCVSFAKKSAPKKGGIPAGTPPLEALDYTFWKVNTTSPPASGAISSTVLSNS